MKLKFKIEGLKELDSALQELPKSTQRAVLRRVLKEAAQPFLADAKAKVPVDEGFLRNSLIIGTRLNKKRAREARKEGKSHAEMYIGTNSRNGVPREFGTWRTPASPFMRPAFAANKDQAIKFIKNELGEEIAKAAKRLARKTAKLAAKG